ncbi:hypothetical protein BDU57DRAFT_272584 [Ampelomyces quisqualis]|uniref:GYF domain-containing protein n=1 Tax=Ampelomyces quisqualis TaxID=50730 RepID=A0A6A5QKQ9_AMPQU|nr:hypothetical protein BDU57DRAFT_272584 [Ampelomyces quisqualis]
MASSRGTHNPARPKRAGEHFTRTHHLDGGEPSTKKPRFDPRNPSTLAPDADDEEEDPALEADVIGKGAGIKRNAVNIDGYDSDSSTENFNARAEARSANDKPPANDDASEDDDMFASEDKNDSQDESSRRDATQKKPLRFLSNAEIEGQEEDSKSGGHVAADLLLRSKNTDVESSSDSGDDSDRDRVDSDMDAELGAGSKKHHAPKLDAFNMRAEQEEGRFDEAGNFVRKAYDPEAAQDSWLEGISKKDMKKAQEAKDMRDHQRRERERREDAIITSDVQSHLIALLDVGETPLEALVRYGKLAPNPRKKNPRKKKKSAIDLDLDDNTTPNDDAKATAAKAAITTITECASRLSDRGVEDIYEHAREQIMRAYKRETGEDWVDPRPEKKKQMWEFHWLAAPEGHVNGPYDEATMRAWKEAGQFDAGAEFKRVGQEEWMRVLDFDE